MVQNGETVNSAEVVGIRSAGCTRDWRLFLPYPYPTAATLQTTYPAHKETSTDSCDRRGSDISAERSKRVEAEHVSAGLQVARQIALPCLLQLRELWGVKVNCSASRRFGYDGTKQERYRDYRC
ncbi:hypothetical protein PMIN06_008953 [Paraphaeosphaeria minitans]|uniref:Uncharacterized protein n=1 Tax=Paraphaeosphaeria minitans TaxID=565426 RepID=A0A9P6GN57_9PLEO|nr:hypothetical protein PMIN01_04030 [Paraphaeosphaeria minitans]